MDGDRSFHAQGWFRPALCKKRKRKCQCSRAKRELWNHLFPGILFSAGCYISYGEKISFHGGDIKTGDQFCVRDVARTWNGSRGKIFNTPLSLSPHLNFRFSLDLFRNLFIFATCHIPRQLLKMKLIWNNIFFDTCFDLTFFSFLFLLVRG